MEEWHNRCVYGKFSYLIHSEDDDDDHQYTNTNNSSKHTSNNTNLICRWRNLCRKTILEFT